MLWFCCLLQSSVTLPAPAAKKETKLETNTESRISEPKPEATIKSEDDEETKVNTKISTLEKENVANDGNNKEEDGDEKPTNPLESEDKAKPVNGNIATEPSSRKDNNLQSETEQQPPETDDQKKDIESQTADPNEDTSKKGDEDSILIPPAPTTLFIKSVSPEISRADLVAVSSIMKHQT